MNLTLLTNTLLVGAAATVLAVGFGLAVALWAATLEKRGLIAALAVVALVLPPFLVTNCWIDLLGQNGVWRHWLPLNIYSLGGTVWLLALLTWPVTFLAVSAAWRRIEDAQLEVDPMLRGTALIRWLLLPVAGNALRQAAVLTFVLAINNFAVPAILQVKVLPAELWVSFNTTFDYSAAVALCWPLVVVPLIAVMLLGRSEIGWTWRADGATARAFGRQLGNAWRFGAAFVSLSLVILSVGVPLWQLAANSNTWHELRPAFAAGQSALLHSILFATVTATLVIALGLLIRKGIGSTPVWISFFAPGVLLGIGMIWAFNRAGLDLIYQSAGIVILAYVSRYAAPGWNCVARALRSTDRTLADAARLEGANSWQMLRHVYWPQISRQAAAGWYITYLLCLWDVEALVLIVPPGDETLSLRIFNLLHYGHNTQVNALCLLLVLLALLPLAIWLSWSLRRTKLAVIAGASSTFILPLRLCAFAALRLNRVVFNAKAQSREGAKDKVNRLSLLIRTACLAFLFLTSCSGGSGSGTTAVKSQFFSQVQIIGRRGTGVGQFNKPRSVAVDTNDNIFVIDMTGRLQKFSPSGEFLRSWQMPQTEKGKPKGMCTDRLGNIVLVEPHYTRVNHFSPDGKLVAQWGVNGTNAGKLAFPRGVAINSRNEVYISEYSAVERVQKFTAQGASFLGLFGQPGSGPGEFERVEGLGIDSKDRVYLADSCNHRIQVFSAEDKFLRTYGKAGSGPGELSYPYDVRIDASGVQFVCEFGNSRIQVFDTNDRSVEILGGPGGEPGQFNNPWAICFDSKGNLIVADALNHRVQKFIRKGRS